MEEIDEIMKIPELLNKIKDPFELNKMLDSSRLDIIKNKFKQLLCNILTDQDIEKIESFNKTTRNKELEEQASLYYKTDQYHKAFDIYLQIDHEILGHLYYKGIGCNQDYKKAVERFSRSTDFESIACLGMCYYEGKGCKKDYELAFKFLKVAYENGIVKVAYNLGLCFYYGLGCVQNDKKAFECFSCVSTSKSLYFQGEICYTTSKEDALEYYIKALNMGYKKAANKIVNCLSHSKKSFKLVPL